MISFFQDYYDIILSFHLISVISWMAGMLYLPRLFVYHTRLDIGTDSYEMFKEMERKLLRYIITPAMAGAWIFGLMMAFGQSLWSEPWFLVKFACVIMMSGFRDILNRWHKDFVNHKNTKSEKFFRYGNEVPTILMIIIVFLVILKPF